MTSPEALTWLAEKLPTDPEIKGLDPVATQQWKKGKKEDWAGTNPLKSSVSLVRSQQHKCGTIHS
jgi:hypothetical protein